MDFDVLAQFISTIGFPIAAFLLIHKDNKETRKEYAEEMKETREAHSAEMKIFSEALANNTRVLEGIKEAAFYGRSTRD